jgi:hypothetical protein
LRDSTQFAFDLVSVAGLTMIVGKYASRALSMRRISSLDLPALMQPTIISNR